MLVEEQLIEDVRRYQVLYDTKHPNYTKSKLKTKIWLDIAKELNIKDGEEAKNMWLKLRAGFRDARRRHQKYLKSGATPQSIKPWKYQRQMSFLLPFMSSGQREENIEGSDEDSQLLSELSTNEYVACKYEESAQLYLPENAAIEEDTEVPDIEQPFIKNEERNDDENRGRTESVTINVTPLISTKRRKKINNVRAVLSRSLVRRGERARRRAEEPKNPDDHLFNFFKSMYQVTKAMPQQYQHRVRAQVFQAVSDAEAEVINIRPQSVTSLESSSSNLITQSPCPTPHPFPHTSSD